MRRLRKAVSLVFALCALLFAALALIASVSQDWGALMVLLILVAITLAASIEAYPGEQNGQ